MKNRHELEAKTTCLGPEKCVNLTHQRTPFRNFSGASTNHKRPVVPCLYREHEFFLPVNIRATLSHLRFTQFPVRCSVSLWSLCPPLVLSVLLSFVRPIRTSRPEKRFPLQKILVLSPALNSAGPAGAGFGVVNHEKRRQK